MNEKTNQLYFDTKETKVAVEQYERAEDMGIAVNTYESIVHPIIDKLMLMRTLGLRNLVFMMGKLQVLPTTMNVKLFTQNLLCHG